jgi:hypothetical protein
MSCTKTLYRGWFAFGAAVVLLGSWLADAHAQSGGLPLPGESQWMARPAEPAASSGIFRASESPQHGTTGASELMGASPADMSGSAAAPPPDAVPFVANNSNDWCWQFAPNGLLYPAYLAGTKESRMGTQAVYVRGYGWEWDTTLGGRFGLFRYGTDDPIHPEGWQLDIEGAAFPRLDLMLQRELRSTDFRAGVPLTYRKGLWESKLAYYHLCSHAGDQFMLDFPEVGRVPYMRDAMVVGLAVRPAVNFRLYSEFGWAFSATGGSKPCEFQFGVEYSSQQPTGLRGAPFAAINAHLRQENNFGGNVTFETGWQWRGQNTHLVRAGLVVTDGMGEQYQVYNHYESQIGFGLWYDF